MLDAAKKAVLAGGHGPARDAALLEAEAGKAAAALVRTRGGLFLVSAPRQGPLTVAAVRPSEMRYVRALLSDKLTVGDTAYAVGMREAKNVRQMIARARLDNPRLPALRSVLVVPLSRTERSVLGRICAHDEPVLLVARTDNTREVTSPLTDPVAVRLLLVVTLRRTLLVGVTELGDYSVTEKVRALSRTADGVSFEGAPLDKKGERNLLVKAARLEALDADERIFFAFAENIRRADDEIRAEAGAAALFEDLRRTSDDRAAIASYFLGRHLEDHAPQVDAAGLDDAVQRCLARDDGPSRLRRTYVALGLDVDAGAQLLARADRVAEKARTLPLADALWARRKDAPDASAGHAAADAEHALHLAEAGEHERALALVGRRWARLPSHQIHEFVEDEDEPRALRAVRAELLRAKELSLIGLGRDVTSTLTALCQNDPFDVGALGRLAAGADPVRAARAALMLALLQPGGLAPDAPRDDDEVPARPAVRALDPEDLDALRHPEATHRDLLVALQEFLAEEDKPDVRALRNFCQRLDPKKYPALAAVVTDAMFALRLSKIDVFVSAGKKSLGVRAFREKPRLVIVGERHLDPGDAHHLPVGELRFLVSTELAHLAFDHVRVTADEVWRGAWDKSKTGLDLALTLLPAFKGAKLIDKVRTVLSVGKKAVRRVDKTTKRALRDETIGAENAALLEAHQLMQLSADRAGLLLCDDLKAAVRALFVTKPEDLALADRFGLARALRRRGDDGELLDEDRLMRAQALFAFYLDDAFDALRGALYAPSHADDAEDGT